MRLIFLFISLLFFSGLGKYYSEDVVLKCKIEMIEYRGEGAYIAVSLMDENNKYLKTLHVLGEDKTWFFDMRLFWANLKSNGLIGDDAYYAHVDGITGPTIGGGKNLVVPLLLNKSEIGKGYKILFETAVEDKGYFKSDLNFELTEKSLNDNFEGTGFIKSVRTLSN
tara:strand:- start:314 stop:814 length:501 start_codon:yes stop_codon:yes gene_type:complete